MLNRALDFAVTLDRASDSGPVNRGWPKISDEEERHRWVRELSDHGLLFFEVQRRQ